MKDSYYKAPSMSASLGSWLDRASRWHIEYGGYLSNHLTHNWVVMGAVDASDKHMQWWEDLYTQKLGTKPARSAGALEPCRPSPESLTITDANWLDHIEREREAFPAYREFFAARLAALGVSAVLNEYLPPLLPGLAGAALHPLIHTGWAVEADHAGMIADGLAYMATAFQPLGTDVRHVPPSPVWSPDAPRPIAASLGFLSTAKARGLADIAQEASQTVAYRALGRGYFQHRMITFDDPNLALAAALNEAGPLGLPPVDESLLPAIEEAVVFLAAALRGSKNEFFVLHGLTSLHAVLTLIPHLDAVDQRAALTYWWRAAMAAVVAQDLPGLEETAEIVRGWLAGHSHADTEPYAIRDDERAWWLATVRSTLASLDEHVPKAVYALWRWAEWGVFSQRSVSVFEDAARDISKPFPNGEVDQHLWFSRPFADAPVNG